MEFWGKQPGKTTLTSNGISTIRGNVMKYPDNIALRMEGFSETYAEMWQRSVQMANALLERGYKKPDLGVTYMTNTYQFIEILLANQMIGLTMTFGNYRLTPDEIIYQINDCGAKVLYVMPEQYDLIYPLMNRLPTIQDIIVIGEGEYPGALNYEEFLSQGSKTEPQVEVLPEDTHLLFYTSGTTGKPKGALRTMYCNYNMGVSTICELGINRNDSLFVVAPMYSAATAGYYYATLMAGGCLCIAPAFIPEECLRLMDFFKTTFVFMVPIMYDWLFNHPPETLAKYDLSTTRLAVACGSPMHTHIFQKMRDGFKNARCYSMLGCSEIGYVAIISAEEWLDQGKAGSIGKGTFDMDIRVIDMDGVEQTAGGIGQLYGRSPQSFNGYWNNEAGTKEAFIDAEWSTVGDMAYMDEDGYYFLVDRAKDLIVSGGANIYPVEVESVILQMEGIADVGVIGVPSEKWGEEVKAVVVLKFGAVVSEEEIIEFCRDKLAGYKIPKSVDYTNMIPRSIIGKMLKKDLRKKYWEGRDTFIS